MKKLFITALGAFAFTLMFSISSQNESLVKNSAFADGTCCPETGSNCSHGSVNIPNYYYKTEGSCKPKKPTIQAIQ